MLYIYKIILYCDNNKVTIKYQHIWKLITISFQSCKVSQLYALRLHSKQSQPPSLLQQSVELEQDDSEDFQDFTLEKDKNT